MTNYSNKSIVLASRPVGEPIADNFRLETTDVAGLEEGQVLIKTLYLSLDPYMRGRMSEAKSYADPVAIGEVMAGETAGVVVESKSDLYAVGDHVCSRSGWQEYFVSDASDPMTYRVDADLVPLSAYLGVCGMPGRTAYFGLQSEGKPKAAKHWWSLLPLVPLARWWVKLVRSSAYMLWVLPVARRNAPMSKTSWGLMRWSITSPMT